MTDQTQPRAQTQAFEATPVPEVKVTMPSDVIAEHFAALFAVARGFQANLLSAQHYFARLAEARYWAQAAMQDMQQVKAQQEQMQKMKGDMEAEVAKSKLQATAQVQASNEDAIAPVAA